MNEDVFFKDQSKIFRTMNGKVSNRKRVIKSQEVQVGQPRKINHARQVIDLHEQGKVSPLYNNDQLIGIVYECSCGRVAQVLFDFEEQEQPYLENQAAG